MTTISGQCLCGACGYTLANAPLRTTLCSCHFCQRATGAAQATIQVGPLADMTVHGAPAVHDHVSDGSGKVLHIHFCQGCGTKLFMTYERWPTMYGIFSGTLDDPTHVTLDPATTKQIFVASARPDMVLLAGVPAFWEHATTLEGAPIAPLVLDTPTAVQDLPR